MSLGLSGSRVVYLVGWLACGFFGGLFGCLLVCVAAGLVCLRTPVWVFLRCMCVEDIVLVDVGSCLQSGSQQSPDL